MAASKKNASASRDRPRPSGTGSREPRSCVSCRAKLASDHSGRFCSPCQESGQGLPGDQQVVNFALGLYPLRQTLGVLGLDYIFFHRDFNDELQHELAELRQQLYGQPEPPRPLPLEEAAALAERAELDDTRPERLSSGSPIDELIAETSLAAGSDRLLLHGFDELRRPEALRQNAPAVSRRLRELEDELPAAIGTLHLALVCGTTPLPPGIRASSGPRIVPRLGFIQTFVLNVFSAKERDVRTAYADMLGDHFTYTKKDFVPLMSRWQSRGPLPVLEIICIPNQARVPTPATVQRFFKKARTPVGRFFDGAIKVRDYGYALRAWTMLVLTEKRKMSHREALVFWNKRGPGGLRYQVSAANRTTRTGESVLSQELRRLRRRIKRWQVG